MVIQLTNEMAFGFTGPNLCILGNTLDFRNFAESLVDLTNILEETSIEIEALPFIKTEGNYQRVVFSSKKNGNKLAVFTENVLLLSLDWRYWERIFKYLVLMSWDKKTYYLNSNENCLADFNLQQECNLILSSEF